MKQYDNFKLEVFSDILSLQKFVSGKKDYLIIKDLNSGNYLVVFDVNNPFPFIDWRLVVKTFLPSVLKNQGYNLQFIDLKDAV